MSCRFVAGTVFAAVMALTRGTLVGTAGPGTEGWTRRADV